MKYFVVEPFVLETPQGTATLPAGQVLELSKDQAARLGGKVKLIHPNGGRDLPYYCPEGGCHCSAKLPDADYPAECIRIKCDSYQAA